MRVAVIGAGRLGLRTIARLMTGTNPPTITGTTRSPERAASIEAAGAKAALVDLNDSSALDKALSDAQLVIFSAAPGAGGDRAAVYEAGLEAALRAARGAQRFIFVSSTAVYSHLEAGAIANEDIPAVGGDPRGRQMAAAEAAVQKAFGAGAQILRLAGLYSQGRGPFHFISKALQEGRALSGSGDRWLNLIHDEDAADALKALVDDATLPLILGADGQGGSRADLYGAFAKDRGYSPPRFQEQGPGGYRVQPRLRSSPLRYPSFAEALAAGAV